MKLALVFLLVFVATSYQQQYQKKFYWAPVNHQQDQPSRFQHYQHPFEGEVIDQDIDPSMVMSGSDFSQPWADQHYYQRKKAQYPNNGASPNISPLFWYMNPGMMNRQGLLFRNYLNALNPHLFEDEEESIKSRRRYPSTAVDPAQERFFGLLSGSFGGSPIVSNTSAARPAFGAFFTKTFVSIVSLLINSTSTPLCIVNSYVTNVPCKRRRRGMKIPDDFYVPDDVASQISPSSTEKYEMTAGISNDDVESFAFYKKENEKINKFLLESSKEDVVVVENGENEHDLGEREKRQFVVSTTTTLTSYSIVQVLASEKQISINNLPAAGSTTLICLPPGLKVCT